MTDLIESHEGGCLCGKVRYTVAGPLRGVSCCHCSQCRRQTGLYYATTEAAAADMTILGVDNLSTYRASTIAIRQFCKTCGSALFWIGDNSDRIGILAGSLDSPTGLKLTHHIFCESKGDYYTINDGLPQFTGEPEEAEGL